MTVDVRYLADDVEAAAAFYLGHLGFVEEGDWQGAPFRMIRRAHREDERDRHDRHDYDRHRASLALDTHDANSCRSVALVPIDTVSPNSQSMKGTRIGSA